MPEELTERIHQVEDDFAEAVSWSYLDRQGTNDYSGHGTEIERILDREGQTVEAVWNSTWTEIVPGIGTRREAERRCVQIFRQACPVRILFRSWIEYVSYTDQNTPLSPAAATGFGT